MKIPRLSPLKQIRKHCLDCMGDSIKSVRFCHDTNCPFWYLRFGKRPKTFIRENGKNYEQLFDRDNFKKGGKFSPDDDISSYKL